MARENTQYPLPGINEKARFTELKDHKWQIVRRQSIAGHEVEAREKWMEWNPRYMSLYGVVSRWLRYRGRSRPEMADDCPEKIDREFLTYVWNFEKTESPELEENLAAFGPGVPVCVLKSRRENDRLLARLAAVH